MLSKNREKHLLQTHFNTKNPKQVPDHLSQFGCRSADTTDEVLFFITKYITSIDRLSLGDSFITADGLQLLQKLQRVLYLDLSGVPLDDDNLTCILHFKELEYLYVSHTNVTPEGIYRMLRSFPALETLVANIPYADEALLSAWALEFPRCELVISLV